MIDLGAWTPTPSAAHPYPPTVPHFSNHFQR